jgi:hypothetical protein
MEYIAKQNQEFYNNLSKSCKIDYVKKIYKYYGNKIPLIFYSLKSILWNFNNLKKKQKFLIKNNKIFDIDHEKHKVEINNLHNFYNNKVLLKKYSKIYRENYREIIHNFLINIHTNYLRKTQIYKLSNISFIINPLSFQDSFIKHSAHHSYHFKYIIEMIYKNEPLILIDINPLNGDNLIGTISIEDKIKQYMTIENDKNLYKSYNKMINDLSKENNKYQIINENIDKIYFLDKINNTNLVFYHIQDITDYDYIYKTLYLPIFTLIKDGYLIICTEKDDGEKIINKMKNNLKISYEKTIVMKTNVDISYIIFKKNVDNLHYKFIENCDSIIDMNINDNPQLKILNIKVNDKSFNVIQDNVLLCGTKQRAVRDFLKKILPDTIENIVYASSHNGYGPIASAYGAKILNKVAYVFLCGVPIDDNDALEKIMEMKQIKTLLNLNAKIFLCQNYDIARTLKYEISTITFNKDWIMRDNFFIPEMGFHDYKTKVFSTILANKIKIASKGTIMETTKSCNIWLVAGSGGILESIYKVFPMAHFYVFLTGFSTFYYNVLKWAKYKKNVTILNNNKDYVLNTDVNDYYKYYESVQGYDSRIFPYIKQFGKNGDFIWNVSSD